MHHFILPSQDTWISSGSSTITGESFKDQNFGQDEILELKKFFYNNRLDHQTRVLVQFDLSELSQSVANGTITNPKYFLRLYEANGTQDLSTDYTIAAFPLSYAASSRRSSEGDASCESGADPDPRRPSPRRRAAPRPAAQTCTCPPARFRCPPAARARGVPPKTAGRGARAGGDTRGLEQRVSRTHI